MRRRLRRATQEIGALNATLEQQVRQRTVHLERANQDLEAFAYTMAHDLRTPLEGKRVRRALVDDYGDHLDETGRDFAGRVEAGCVRMAALIDDLLHLSQVARAEMNLQDFDLSAEVTAICGQLRARDPGRQVKVTVQDGVRVIADRTLIRAALDNLLDTSGSSPPAAGRRHEFGTHPSGTPPSAVTFATTGPASTRPARHELFQRQLQRLPAPATHPAPASAWPASAASSSATAAGPGQMAPSTAALPSTSPSTQKAVHEQ